MAFVRHFFFLCAVYARPFHVSFSLEVGHKTERKKKGKKGWSLTRVRWVAAWRASTLRTIEPYTIIYIRIYVRVRPIVFNVKLGFGRSRDDYCFETYKNGNACTKRLHVDRRQRDRAVKTSERKKSLTRRETKKRNAHNICSRVPTPA